MTHHLRECIDEVHDALMPPDGIDPSRAWVSDLIGQLGDDHRDDGQLSSLARCAMGWMDARIADGQMHRWEDAVRCAHAMATGQSDPFTGTPERDFDIATQLYAGIFDEAERREYGRVIATSRLG